MIFGSFGFDQAEVAEALESLKEAEAFPLGLPRLLQTHPQARVKGSLYSSLSWRACPEWILSVVSFFFFFVFFFLFSSSCAVSLRALTPDETPSSWQTNANRCNPHLGTSSLSLPAPIFFPAARRAAVLPGCARHSAGAQGRAPV